MTTRMLFKSFLSIAAAAIFSGCISVNIGPKGPEKSKNVSVTPPPPAYQELKGVRADGAWRNPKTGNTISYLSTCNDPADPSVESASDEVISAMGAAKNLTQKKIDFDGRDAIDSEAEARVEGVPTKIRALVFKKNGCLYTISLVGVAKKFAQAEGDFDSFVKGFNAP